MTWRSLIPVLALSAPMLALPAAQVPVELDTRVVAKPPASPARLAAPPRMTPRQRFLEMWARGYFPGRSGQIFVVPREGDIITRRDPDVTFMHGSPWPYDTVIPLFFHGPNIRPGVYRVPARQQDVAPTLAAILRTRMPASATGRVLTTAVRSAVAPPKVVLLAVLDGFRADYFDRYVDVLPTLTRLRRSSASYPAARIDYLPTNTGVGHTTISTGTDPRIHGITGNNLYDRVAGKRFDSYEGWSPRDLMAATLSDVWTTDTNGAAVIIAQGSSVPPAAALAGHGACLLNGRKPLMAGYDSTSGRWGTNPQCYSLPPYLADADAKKLWGADGLWMGHKIDTTAGVRRTGLFPAFEGDALVAMIEREPVGADAVTDLVLVNLKGADFVGHKHGPDSPEIRATLVEMDRQLTRIVDALARKAGGSVVVAVVADHGMPAEPASPERRRISEEIVSLVHDTFDPQEKKLIAYYEPENGQLMVDPAQLAARGLTLARLARFLESQPFIYAAYTEDEVRSARVR